LLAVELTAETPIGSVIPANAGIIQA